MCGLIEVNLDSLGVTEDETDIVRSEAIEFLRLSAKRPIRRAGA